MSFMSRMKPCDSGWNSASEFMPPRAGRLAGLRLAAERALRQLRLNELVLPDGLLFRHVLLSLLVPGFGFVAARQRKLGKWAMAASGVLVLIYVLFLGRAVGGVAFGLLVSVHVSSFLFLIDHHFRHFGPRRRVVNALLAVGLFWLVLYLPVQGWLERHVVFPVRVGDQVLILRSGVNPAQLRRGDWVAFDSGGRWFEDGVLLERGLQFGPVVALPGDTVEFFPDRLLVNGRPQPLLANMPTAGAERLPQNCWLIWPNVTISRTSGHAAELLLKVARVYPEQLRGRPLGRWFWHKQS